MKIGITIDCSPEEARSFMGLPDVRPLQDAVMAQLQQQMVDATKAMSPEAILRAWLPMVPQSPEQMRDAMAGMVRLFVPNGGVLGNSGGEPGSGKS